MNSGRHELVVAVGVGMDEFAEDEAFLLFGEKRTRKVWQVYISPHADKRWF